MNIEDHQELIDYLRHNARVARDELPRVTTLAGGVSNRTVLLERQSGESWVFKQALEKLRVPVDWFSDPRRIEQEALGIEYLARLAPTGTIPPLIFIDPSHHLLAMQAVPRPHENWKSMLLASRVDLDHVRQFAEIIALIHARSASDADPSTLATKPSELARIFDDRTFFESLRLEPYYVYTAQQVPPAADFLNSLIATCRSRRLALVHGDYSPKNILIHADRLILLDHEVIHYGDPAFDIGFALAHLLSKAHHLGSHRSQFAEAATLFWRHYLQTRYPIEPEAQARGSSDRLYGKSRPLLRLVERDESDLENHAIRHTLGCLLARVAGRSQLEYLTPAKKHLQLSAVVSLIAAPPFRLEDLITTFIAICR